MTGVDMPGRLRLLFVKNTLGFPRAAGHDIRCYEMLRAFEQLGHSVGLATVAPLSASAAEGLRLDYLGQLTSNPATGRAAARQATRFQSRFARYWGVDQGLVAACGETARSFGADAVIAVGLDALPYLTSVEGAATIWYAGDEWVSHHLSQVRFSQPSTWSEITSAIIKGLYERAHASVIDRVWVVAEHEAGPMRRFAGMRTVDVVTNGVDVDYYRPLDSMELPSSALFWGRLDFGPNIQALTWLCENVWPQVRQRVPDAVFEIVGFRPGPEVAALAGNGVTVAGEVEDIRPEAARHAVVLLPFWSGGGIKNKLLEALAMAKAVVCTPQASRGLHQSPPLVVATTPAEWAGALCDLWADGERRRQLGTAGRAWVVEHHTWQAAAQEAARQLSRPANSSTAAQDNPAPHRVGVQ